MKQKNEEDGGDSDGSKHRLIKEGYGATAIWTAIACITTIITLYLYMPCYILQAAGAVSCKPAHLAEIKAEHTEYYGEYDYAGNKIKGNRKYKTKNEVPKSVDILVGKNGNIYIPKPVVHMAYMPVMWAFAVISYYADKDALKKAAEEKARKEELKRKLKEKKLNRCRKIGIK